MCAVAFARVRVCVPMTHIFFFENIHTHTLIGALASPQLNCKQTYIPTQYTRSNSRQHSTSRRVAPRVARRHRLFYTLSARAPHVCDLIVCVCACVRVHEFEWRVERFFFYINTNYVRMCAGPRERTGLFWLRARVRCDSTRKTRTRIARVQGCECQKTNTAANVCAASLVPASARVISLSLRRRSTHTHLFSKQINRRGACRFVDIAGVCVYFIVFANVSGSRLPCIVRPPLKSTELNACFRPRVITRNLHQLCVRRGRTRTRRAVTQPPARD